MEHCGNCPWSYQVRWPASKVPDYREWQPLRTTSGEKAVEPISDPTVIMEARWRWVDEEDAAWQPAQPHEWGGGRADFHVILKQPRDFRADPIVHAAAAVRGIPAAFELSMPPQVMAPGVFTVEGRSLMKGLGTVLCSEGDFVCVSDAFAISNAGASQVALQPVPPRVPASLPVGIVFGVYLGMLTPEEIEMLHAYTASKKREVPHG